ncbi:alpha/beta fold hydrolase [Streptomyces canus]|uniref:alpha/beta fold hydrolase n=1 Tax=Streptomyces canus TaxID=58343 RepID=UPI00277D6E2A|nr:pimeloyl-ACP methyl ester carboxylesterase [Streptomyces canus]
MRFPQRDMEHRRRVSGGRAVQETQSAAVGSTDAYAPDLGGQTQVDGVHGWPQNSDCWRPVLADLAADYTVVAPDLRGYGLSDKPATGYDKRRMAADVAGLVEVLGFERAMVVGHDRGARVGHHWALDRPDQVERPAVLDIVPTRKVSRRLDVLLASGYWHWLFHHRGRPAADSRRQIPDEHGGHPE